MPSHRIVGKLMLIGVCVGSHKNTFMDQHYEYCCDGIYDDTAAHGNLDQDIRLILLQILEDRYEKNPSS